MRGAACEHRVRRFVEQAEHGQARGGGERVPAERPRLVHRAVGREHGHHVRPPAERSQRQPTTYHLAEAREVGRHAVVRLRAARAEPEARDDLVEDQQRAGCVTRVAQALEEAGRGRDEAHVRRHRLHDHARDRVVDGRHDVVRHHDGVGHRGAGHARRPGQPQGGDATAGGGEQMVGVTVVAAGELHDAVAPREPACHPDGRHGGLGAARDQAHPLAARDARADGLGQQHLALGRRSVRRAILGGTLHGLDHGGVCVTEDRRAPRLHVVRVATAIRVPDVTAFGARHEVRGASDVAEGTHGRVDPAGNDTAGALEQLLVAAATQARPRPGRARSR